MRIKRVLDAVIVALLLNLVVAGCSSTGRTTGEAASSSKSVVAAPRPLRVALFPYVPNKQRMEELILERWGKVSSYPIEFVEFWDGYSSDPTEDLDVFEFDAMSLEYFVRNGFVAPVDPATVVAPEDIADFAWDAAHVDGMLYGVPRLACTFALFYRDGDIELEQAKGLADLERVLAPEAGGGMPPEAGRGLLIDLTGSTDCVSLYFDALLDTTGKYSIRPQLPSVAQLDQSALANLQVLARIAGRPQATFEDDTYRQRSQWFAEGRGRAFVGYTERAGVVPPAATAEWRVRLLPMGPENKVNMCFVDVLSISPRLRGERQAVAQQFVAFATASETVLACLMPPPDGQTPSQYLLPVRRSVAEDPALQAAAPLYRDLVRFIDPESNPRAHRFGEEGRAWLDANKREIRSKLFP